MIRIVNQKSNIDASSQSEIVRIMNEMAIGYFSNNIDSSLIKNDIGNALFSLQEKIKSIIKKINAISDGNFSVKTSNTLEKDHLSHALNKMIDYIKLNIEENQKKDRIKTGISELNQCMRSAETIEDLTSNIIQFIVKNNTVVVGAIYVLNDDNIFTLSSSHNITVPENKSLYNFVLGEGLIGQLAHDKKAIIHSNVPSHYLKIKTGLGECQPNEIVIIPVVREEKTIAIIELGTLNSLSDLQFSFLQEISSNIGVAISSINAKKQLKELYLESQSQQLALQRSNEELEQYAHVISHDLKEPLRGISGYLEYLKEDFSSHLEPAAIAIIDNTINESNRLHEMISAVLSYAKVALDGDSFSRVNTEAVLALALHNLQTSIIERNSTITHDPLPDIYGDQGQVVQLFQNLIGNGIKYCENQNPCVHIGAIKKEGKFEFSFRDNGIGIKENKTSKIFIIFERLHNREKYPGTGIGLSICKKIVERHKGEIWVKSVEGAGSTFYFTIPFEKQ